MTMDNGTILAGVGMLVGGLVWLVRLEGRLNVTDSRYGDMKADLDEIKADVRKLLLRSQP